MENQDDFIFSAVKKYFSNPDVAMWMIPIGMLVVAIVFGSLTGYR